MNINPLAARDYLVSKGLHPTGAAAMLGNVKQESGYNPGAVGDNGKSFGLFQWQKDRRVNLEQEANKLGKPVADPYVQMDFALKELGGMPQLLAALQQGGDPRALAVQFSNKFERPNPQFAALDNRAEEASRLVDERVSASIIPELSSSLIVPRQRDVGALLATRGTRDDVTQDWPNFIQALNGSMESQHMPSLASQF